MIKFAIHDPWFVYGIIGLYLIMFDTKVYNDGSLIVGKMSGIVEPQSFINGIFWQIDSRNVGEVKEGFSQLYYDDNVASVRVTESDIKKLPKLILVLA